MIEYEVELFYRLTLCEPSRSRSPRCSGVSDSKKGWRSASAMLMRWAGSYSSMRSIRSNSDRSGTTPAHDWMNYPDKLASIEQRLAGVVIENGDALKCMQRYDREDCLHYVDPPYVHATRSRHAANNGYTHEMEDAEHQELAQVLHDLSGYVVLSGYPSDLYDELYGDWKRVDREALADGARPRIESLWMNPKTSQALDGGLFAQAKAL